MSSYTITYFFYSKWETTEIVHCSDQWEAEKIAAAKMKADSDCRDFKVRYNMTG